MATATTIVGKQYYQEFKPFLPLNTFYEKLETSVTISPGRYIENLESIYIFLNPEDIKKFLLLNKDLITILFEAPEYIRKIFGKVPLYLEFHNDPEEEWDELFIVIKTNYSPEKAVELERELFEKWFVQVLERVSGRLNITEEPL